MEDHYKNIDMMFLQLVLSLQAGAMQQMGKVASPFTGKVERDLSAAKYSIDVVEMLDKKMAGNLSKEEDNLIKHVLTELRLNYLDEQKKPETTPEPAEEKPEEKSEDQSE